MTKDEYKCKINEILINKDKFKLDEASDSNYFTECSICPKLQILLLHSHISEARNRHAKPVGTETLPSEGQKISMSLVYC